MQIRFPLAVIAAALLVPVPAAPTASAASTLVPKPVPHGAELTESTTRQVPLMSGAPQRRQPVASHDQAPGFERVIGGLTADRGVLVTSTRDGGYVVVGVTQSAGTRGEDVSLIRTDAAGDVLWSRAIGGDDEDNGWAVREVSGGFVVAGFTRSHGSGGYDFYLVRTDAAGELTWSRTYGGLKDDRCWALAVTGDDGFVLAGETNSDGAGERDFLLVRTDSSGRELWSRTYGGEKDDRCFSVVTTEDGGYVLAGQTFSEGAGDRDAWILKVDGQGRREWSRTFGGTESDVAHSVCRTRDGAFFVTGYTTSLAKNGDDPYLIKIKTDGQVEWTRVIPIPGIAHTITGEQATDGGYFCVGFQEPFPGGRRRALLIKTDATGQAQWQWSGLAGTYAESMGYTVHATPDGGCVFTGHVVASRNPDLLLVKIDGTR